MKDLLILWARAFVALAAAVSLYAAVLALLDDDAQPAAVSTQRGA
ncbi:hypothetical protein [Burkholderia sp. IMCC1007]|nr:hypothetical protein [Burkholderia sp. IMCC1007]